MVQENLVAAQNIKPLRDVNIGKYDELSTRERIVLDIDGKEVGVYFEAGEIRAWLNVCPHGGGPVCQGQIMPRTVQDVRPGGKSGGLGHHPTERNIVCPWHGYEFGILSGEHPIKGDVKLIPVAVRVVDGDVVLSV